MQLVDGMLVLMSCNSWDDDLVGELLCVFLQRMGAGYAQLVR